MARQNEILVGRFNRLLQKVLSMKGGPPAPQLASEIMPVLSFWSGAENRGLESWARFIGSVVQVGVAANFTKARIGNPAGSNIVAVIERLTVVSGNFDNIALGYAAAFLAPLSPVATVGAMDTRQPTTSPTLILSIAVFGAAIAAAEQQYVVSFGGSAAGQIANYDYIQTDNQEITVFPGQMLHIGQLTANETLRVNMVWRERFLEDSERT